MLPVSQNRIRDDCAQNKSSDNGVLVDGGNTHLHETAFQHLDQKNTKQCSRRVTAPFPEGRAGRPVPVQFAHVLPETFVGGVYITVGILDAQSTIHVISSEMTRDPKRLIRYFSKRAGVEDTVLLEMEHTIRTLFTIEKEEEWLKSTDRPYRVIEERLNELADRKNTIMQGVNALVAD